VDGVILSRYALLLPKHILDQLLYAHEILRARVRWR